MDCKTRSKLRNVKTLHEKQINSPGLTVQKGRAQTHCHELYPSDAKNHFVLEQIVQTDIMFEFLEITFKHGTLKVIKSMPINF